MAKTFLLKGAGVSDQGLKRTQNQDRFASIPEMNLFIVADGMGGHLGGETASELAITTIVQFFKTNKITQLPNRALKEAIREANQAIQEKSLEDPALRGMGTTTTALFFYEDKLYIGHVGDSRCYLVRPGMIWQLTRDHSLVQEKLRAGMITRDQVKTDKMKNVITRSVGFENDVEVDIYEYSPSPKDAFVVCSDGLHGLVSDDEICKIVSDAIQDNNQLENSARKLVQLANENGGDDNVTVVVLQAFGT
ncbi:MAG: Stp1/IreP family PP2C-type Ser/Thr phosphatase [Bacteriovoracia bacterium]